MAAIVSKEFRLNATKELVNDVQNDSNYYVFIGRSESWEDDQLPPNPYDNYYASFYETWQNMTALKRIGPNDVRHAAIRYQWISGVEYAQYNDRDPDLGTKQYYVITDNNNVYICLKSGGLSTQNPDNIGVEVSGVIDFTGPGGDGYIWKYLFTLPTQDALNFLTSAFVPVNFLTEDPGTNADIALRNLWSVQQNAIDGAIYNVVLTNGGSSYTNAPNVVVSGDGTGFEATAILDETTGIITDVQVDNPGSGYTQIDISFAGGGGSGAQAYAILPPPGGFGADVRNDLRAHFAVINAKLIYDDGQGDFIVGNDFRQIGVIRNPYAYYDKTDPVEVAGRSIASDETLSATKSMVTELNANLSNDMVIVGSSGARAFVDFYDASTGKLRYHQTPETGFADFLSTDTIKDALAIAGAAEYSIISLHPPEVMPYSGEVIFLENRTAINRASDQIETIKLVLEF